MRKCAYSPCQKILVQRAREKPSLFKERKFCDSQCYWKSRQIDERKIVNVTRDCRCPTCGLIFRKQVYYTGPAKNPPFFCTKCKRDKPSSEKNYFSLWNPETRNHVNKMCDRLNAKIMADQVQIYSSDTLSQEELEKLIP